MNIINQYRELSNSLRLTLQQITNQFPNLNTMLINNQPVSPTKSKQKSQNAPKQPIAISQLSDKSVTAYLRNFTTIADYKLCEQGKDLLNLLVKQHNQQVLQKAVQIICYFYQHSTVQGKVCSLQFVKELMDVGKFKIYACLQLKLIKYFIQVVQHRNHVKSVMRGSNYFMKDIDKSQKQVKVIQLIRLSNTYFRMCHEMLYIWGVKYFPVSSFATVYNKLSKYCTFPVYPQQFKFYKISKVDQLVAADKFKNINNLLKTRKQTGFVPVLSARSNKSKGSKTSRKDKQIQSQIKLAKIQYNSGKQQVRQKSPQKTNQRKQIKHIQKQQAINKAQLNENKVKIQQKDEDDIFEIQANTRSSIVQRGSKIVSKPAKITEKIPKNIIYRQSSVEDPVDATNEIQKKNQQQLAIKKKMMEVPLGVVAEVSAEDGSSKYQTQPVSQKSNQLSRENSKQNSKQPSRQQQQIIKDIQPGQQNKIKKKEEKQKDILITPKTVQYTKKSKILQAENMKIPQNINTYHKNFNNHKSTQLVHQIKQTNPVTAHITSTVSVEEEMESEKMVYELPDSDQEVQPMKQPLQKVNIVNQKINNNQLLITSKNQGQNVSFKPAIKQAKNNESIVQTNNDEDDADKRAVVEQHKNIQNPLTMSDKGVHVKQQNQAIKRIKPIKNMRHKNTKSEVVQQLNAKDFWTDLYKPEQNQVLRSKVQEQKQTETSKIVKPFANDYIVQQSAGHDKFSRIKSQSSENGYLPIYSEPDRPDESLISSNSKKKKIVRKLFDDQNMQKVEGESVLKKSKLLLVNQTYQIKELCQSINNAEKQKQQMTLIQHEIKLKNKRKLKKFRQIAITLVPQIKQQATESKNIDNYKTELESVKTEIMNKIQSQYHKSEIKSNQEIAKIAEMFRQHSRNSVIQQSTQRKRVDFFESKGSSIPISHVASSSSMRRKSNSSRRSSLSQIKNKEQLNQYQKGTMMFYLAKRRSVML